MTASVSVGVEWINAFRSDNQPCKPPPPDLIFAGQIAGAFLGVMRSLGHAEVFNWGNDDAWSSDFAHPDFGGDSLNWSDNVHFCYLMTHGGPWTVGGTRHGLSLAFSSNHTHPKYWPYLPCRGLSGQWRLGVKRLKWFVIDSCDIVGDTDPDHIVQLWSGPMQGVHLVFGFIGAATIGEDTHHARAAFAQAVGAGSRMANAWMDTAYRWEQGSTHASRAIAIAAGASRDEAISRREDETLAWVNFPVAATNWLAWKWRG